MKKNESETAAVEEADGYQRVLNEVMNGDRLLIPEAAKLFPAATTSGEHIAEYTVIRWVRNGVSMPGGGRLYLEAVRIGGREVTSRAAVKRFIAAQNTRRQPTALPDLGRSEKQRKRAAARAIEQLEKM